MITCLDDDIGQLFLGDGCADLHSTACLRIDLAAHLTGGKRGAVDTIATGSSTQYNDAMTWSYFARMAAVWQYTQTAAEDERVIYIACMVEYSAIDGGNTHFIAIVAHTV